MHELHRIKSSWRNSTTSKEDVNLTRGFKFTSHATMTHNFIYIDSAVPGTPTF